MKTPKFTDQHRYPHGYVPANATDVTGTWKRFGFDPNAAPQVPARSADLGKAEPDAREIRACGAAPLKFRRKA